MDKPRPSAPRRLTSAHVSLQERESRRANDDDLDATGDSSRAELPAASEGSVGSDGLVLPDSPRIDRSVQTRTHDRITLQGCEQGFGEDVSNNGERGWRSPHGEPYKPLGNPKLSLKFTPQLHGDPTKSARPSIAAKEDGDERKATLVAHGGAKSSPAPAVNVFDMFPRNLRKRPPEDRQVKLAMRLQESVSNYSPDKTRGLRRPNPVTITQVSGEPGAAPGEDNEDLHVAILRLQEQHRRDIGVESPVSLVPSPVRSPRFHVQRGENSFSMLQHAVHQGATRLQLVRNGQSFLDNLFSCDSLDFADLKSKYKLAREKFLVDQEAWKKLGTSIRLPSSVSGNDESDGDDEQNHHHPTTAASHFHGGNEEVRLYLPYTTREPQTSPHKPLPTLAEFKTKAREERMPIRGLVSSRASMATESPGSPPSSPRKPTSRQSRFGSSLIAGSTERPVVQSIAALSPSSLSPQKVSRTRSRRGSVVLTTTFVASDSIEQRQSVPSPRGDTDSDALARVVATLAKSPQSPRVHSVVRLQNAVDLVEAVKDVQAQTLAKTLTLLDHGRRDCLEAKYRNFHIESDLNVDLLNLREASELDRVDSVALNLNSYKWYPELLKNLISNRDSHLLHPAELFCVDVIRRAASEGHAFKSEQLFRLTLMLHPDDVALVEVQHVLTFLRRALSIPMSEWEPFFRLYSLPEPVEVFKQSEDSKLKEKKKQMRMAKLRSVVRINQVLRRLQTPLSQ